MKSLALTLLFLAAVPVAASAQRRPRELPLPSGMSIGGDTTRIGTAVTGVDPNARYLNLTLRAPSRIEVYAVDRTGQMHNMASCWLDTGTTTIRPSLTETISNSATFQAGSSFGNRSSSGASSRTASNAWRYASSQEQLLILVMQEEPTSKRGCDQSGNGAAATFGLMRQAEMLNSLPPTLLRYPDTAWAAFLVQP